MESSEGKTNQEFITVHLSRFDPALDARPAIETYSIPVDEATSVMVLMRALHELDPARACRTSMCFKGACGSCLVRVNGKDVLGCSTLIRPGETITLEPHSGFELVRDLVVDFTHPRASEGVK